MMGEKKNKNFNILNFIASAVIILFFSGVIGAYYLMLQRATENSIIKSGEMNAISSADNIDSYLSTGIDSIMLSAYALDNMIRENRSNDAMLDYLTYQTSAVFELIPANTTGLYAFIGDEYLDGAGWVPDADYVPTERPWYKAAIEERGTVAVVDPYVDLQTGEVIVTLSKLLCDGKSVVAIDLSMEHLQKITEELASGEANSTEIVFDQHYHVIAHSDRNEVGKDYKMEDGALGAAVLKGYLENSEGYFSLEYDGTEYIVYSVLLENSWLCLSISDATAAYSRLRRPLILTILFTAAFITIVVVITINYARKSRLARQLELERETAIAANKAKSDFLSNMSHEIRTPINAVLGMNEMILRESDNGSIRDYSKNIRNAGQTLLGIINDILDLSKIEEGRMEIIPTDYEVSELIGELTLLIRQRAEDKGLKLNIEYDRRIPRRLHGDEIRIRQVILNLLTNAVKYTERGSVTLKVGFEPAPDASQNVILDVRVIDTGIGIREEDISRLFIKFERIDTERNRGIEGTGLGLNITENLLGLMGSHLDVKSCYGEGSTFGFKLSQRVVDGTELGDFNPFAYKHADTPAGKEKHFFAPSASVLAVDDNKVNLLVFTNLIKRTGVSFDTAKSGEECLRMSREKKYDIIFLDYMMPKKNGIETLHELKAQTDNPNADTPTICLTANAVRGAKEECINAGFDGYISKPIDPDELEEIIFRFLPKEKIEEDNR